jgi:carbonic anhydrase/acetyltransferase-like protein (isoleucine patch superfamily)
MLLPYLDHHPVLGERVFVAGSADVIGQVTLGADSSVFFQCVLRGDINTITVGSRTNIQDHTTVHLASDLGVSLGDDVSIGHGCTIHACTLGNRILVGMGAIIMDGCVIGDDCLVAAGSLLPKGKTFPSGSLILGNPARVIRILDPFELASIQSLALKYVQVKNHYLQGV